MRLSVLIGFLTVGSLELWLCPYWSYDGTLDDIALARAMMVPSLGL